MKRETERTYCLICGREMVTESGHVCAKCAADAEAAIENVSCPVCGYYCLGNGGIGCIDKPGMVSGCEAGHARR